MLALLLTAALAASPTRPCLIAGSSEVVTTRKTLNLGKGSQFEGATLSRKGDGSAGFTSSRVVFYSAKCHISYAQEFEGSPSTRISTTTLGNDRVVIITIFYPGGSGCGYSHIVLKSNGDYPEGVLPIAPMDLSHSNMGGFYVGRFGKRRSGMARWDAIWEGAETHYEPHRYRIITYDWRDGRFIGPKVRITKQKFDPSPNDVARKLGLAFHDLTGEVQNDDC